MINDLLIHHYGSLRIAKVYTNRDASGLAHVKYHTRYINNMRKVVRLQKRSGIEMAIPVVDGRSSHANDGEFIIQEELIIGIPMIEQMYAQFNSLGNTNNNVLGIFRDAFMEQYTPGLMMQTKAIHCVIEFVLTEKEFSDVNGILYYTELDTVFKLGDSPIHIPHPYSLMGLQAAGERVARTYRDQYGFIFTIELIDAAGKYGDRYVVICNQVHKLIPKQDNNKQDGIYVISSRPTNGRLSTDELVTSYYSFDDAEKRLGLYTTYEMAASYGDQAAARKRELTELQYAFEMAKQQAQLDKLEADKLIAERDQQLKNLEYERSLHRREMDDLKERQDHLLEMEKMRRKDEFDRRSTERKDASDLIKFLPHFLAGLGMVLMAYKTLKTH